MATSSLIAFTGKENKASYLIQGRDVRKPQLKAGEYPFLYPGACSFFGGWKEGEETPEQTFRREIREETGIVIPESEGFEQRFYDWSRDLDKVYGEINEIFHGNLPGFLGFSLEGVVESCLLGRFRGQFKGKAYREWMGEIMNAENYFIKRLDTENSMGEIKLREGTRAAWIPHQIARAVVMYPSDKLALLHDIAIRVRAGELEI